MKTVITIGVLGLLLVAGFVVVNALQNDQPEESLPVGTCSSSCGNSCTAESNCGNPTCGAISGGSCGCS